MADTLAQVQKDVRFWQRLLTFAGYKLGKVDGVKAARPKPLHGGVRCSQRQYHA